MAELIKKITAEDIAQYGVVAAPDKLEGDPAQNKMIFDRLVRELVANAVNQAIDVVNGISPQIEEWAAAEAQRILNEESRETAEEERDSAEDAREENETGRVNAETLRATNEDTRKTAETQRAAAETVREGNEQARKTAETKRAGAEATRQTNEQTRQNQEQARKTAEAQRETNEQNRKDSFEEEIDQAKSWAVGGTGKRPGEDTNNAKYWSEQAKANVGGDFATNARVDEVETEVGRVAQSVSDLEIQVEQDVGQAIQQVNQTISGLEQSVNTRVQPINLGGTGASEANQARQNLGAAAVKEMTKAEYDALPAIDPTIFYALTDVEADGVKIEVGSYVGTGKYGSSNPNKLTFGFVPKMVLIGLNYDVSGNWSYAFSYEGLYIAGMSKMRVFTREKASGSATKGENIMLKTSSGNVLEWYSNGSAPYQLNNTNLNYVYIAIG